MRCLEVLVMVVGVFVAGLVVYVLGVAVGQGGCVVLEEGGGELDV